MTVFNPSTAFNVSTQSNWLFTFKVKLLNGRLGQFVPHVQVPECRGLETSTQRIRNLFA